MIKTLQLALAALAMALGPPAATAQSANDYPNKPIRFIAPIPAGGSTDVLTRDIARRLQERWGQPTVVENKPGSTGSIGAALVARAPADGYTLLLVNSGHVINGHVYAKLPYDPIKDFSVVGRIGNSSILLVASKDFPANDLKEYIALAKAKPGSIQYGTWGLGSTGHFCAEVLAQKAGIQMQHVPFKGTTQLMTDMLGGHIKTGFVDMATGTPFVRDGKVKALAVCTQRSPSLPQVASYKEQGVDFDQTLSWVMYAPAKVPQNALDKLTSALEGSLKEPEVVQKLLNLGISVDFVPGQEQAAVNVRDLAVWRKIAQDANIKLE